MKSIKNTTLFSALAAITVVTTTVKLASSQVYDPWTGETYGSAEMLQHLGQLLLL